MKRLAKLIVPLAFAVLLGCAQAGLAPAQSIDEKLAYGYATVTSVRTGAAAAVGSGAIGAADARRVLAATDDARLGLDTARAAAAAGDSSGAASKLALATSALLQIQQFLAAKGVK